MQLSEYIESILPLIRASRKFRSKNSHAANHVRYLYGQAFYGFDEYAKRKASVENIETIVNEKFICAWILKTEDAELDKAGYRSKRPENPIDAYTEVGIILED